jgi:PAS domain S-box-containing protein
MSQTAILEQRQRQKILIVDDKEANLFALEKILKEVDVDVIRSIDGQSALAQVLDHNFALILLDVRMPGMDGYEVAECLNGDSSTKAIPIIFVTAEYPDEAHMFKGYEVGAIDYILKPYSSKILLAKVNALLEMDRNRAELKAHRDNLEGLVQERTKELADANKELQQYSWILEKEQGFKTESVVPNFDDLTALNQGGLILNSVGADTLQQMSSDVMDLLDSSMAVYEENGDYAFASFVSNWCGTMNNTSHALCNTNDCQKAINCGQWHCHESCWKISKAAIDSGEPADEACLGGLRIYAVPVRSEGKIIGAVNFGYSTPPKTLAEKKTLAETYQIDLETIQQNADTYKPRPPFIIEFAKRHLQSIAHRIGEIVERKQAETAFRNIFEVSSDLICVANPSGEYIKVSRSCEEILGYTPEEFMNLGWPKLVHPDDTELTRDKMAKQLEGATAVNFINRFRHKDGSYKSLEWNATPCTDCYLYGAARDITERKKAEEALYASEEMMRNSQSVAHICSYSTNLNVNEIAKSAWVCSPQFYQLFGIDETYPHTIEGWANLIHPDYRKEVYDYHEMVVKEKKTFNREYKIIRINDGEERWVQGTGKIESDENGNPVRMHGAIQDITKRKNREEALARSEARFRGTFENATIGIAHVGQDGRYLEVNETLCQMIGYKREELIEKKFHEITHADDLESDFELFAQLKSGKIPTYRIEKRYIHRDGRIIWVQNTTAMQNDENGKPLYCISLERDICKEKEMALSLEKALKMAKASNIAKSQFISNMSHELRTPLNPIIGLSDMLLEIPDDKDQVIEFAEIINKSGLHMLTLVESILDFSKIKSGKMTFQSEWFDLNQPFKKACTVLSHMCQKRGLELHQKMANPSNLEIQSDASAILQVAINLIGNAIKFTDSGSIRIETSLDSQQDGNGKLTFSISDTGVGISDEDQARIWDPFECADNSISRRHDGTGLGLAISRAIIERMNGSIGLHSVLGQGTSFTVEIPVKYRSAPKAAASEKSTSTLETGVGKKRVLMVEDDLPNQLVGQKILEKLGCSVTVKDSGLAALEALEHGVFDLVLMDLKMPGIDGIETTRRIQAKYQGKPPFPIIALTADASEDAKRKCEKAGFQGFLTKPVRIELLQKCLSAKSKS